MRRKGGVTGGFEAGPPPPPAMKIEESWGVWGDYPQIHPTPRLRGLQQLQQFHFRNKKKHTKHLSYTALHLQDSFSQQRFYQYNYKVGWPDPLELPILLLFERESEIFEIENGPLEKLSGPSAPA